MPIELDIVVSHRAQCGEGPVWDAESGTVVSVDIMTGEIFRSAFPSGETTGITYPTWVGAAAPRVGGGFVAAVTTGLVGLDEQGSVTHRADCLPEGVRFNDAKVGANGIFWAGSCAMDFAAGKGGFWRLDASWEPELVIPGLQQPNGLGWSPDGRTLYLIETQVKQVWSFPFDPATSRILHTTPTVVVDADQFAGYPDGLTIDTRGHLWIAEFGGAAVYEFAPDGTKLQTIAIPTAQPTSCAFVGPNLDELWVTSAAVGLDDDPNAGAIFRVTGLGATGIDIPRFNG
ncbi:MAG TPA: SMP-30/gluconolactonase/LRE family protein [Candidatus Lumbricidophila sp.]|nr:SMP-30/gluconolactonase/LRE family protein [Candidatus Lumbricidophila sp.]